MSKTGQDRSKVRNKVGVGTERKHEHSTKLHDLRPLRDKWEDEERANPQ